MECAVDESKLTEEQKVEIEREEEIQREMIKRQMEEMGINRK
jgi:hypothetical protein